jgi:hypothetical protein
VAAASSWGCLFQPAHFAIVCCSRLVIAALLPALLAASNLSFFHRPCVVLFSLPFAMSNSGSGLPLLPEEQRSIASCKFSAMIEAVVPAFIFGITTRSECGKHQH